ncbi:MAG: hypothetical protein ACLQO7_05620 [Candidatus Bathyarchaeia archaeon]
MWLAKIGKINLLKNLFNEIIVPQEVYVEAVDEGLKHGFSDALTIKECVNDGWIKLAVMDSSAQNLIRKIVENAAEINFADAQAIVLAKEMKVLLLMDESAGRTFAEAWGLKTKGSLYVVMSALRAGLMNKEEAKETVVRMVSKGFRLEPNLLARLIIEIEQL